MKILFVASGNSSVGISPIIKNQADSLMKYLPNLTIDYFCIKGKGLKGYVKNIKPLRKQIKGNSYDIIHAHYSFSAFCASLAGAKSLVVSLMGSDVKASMLFKLLIKCFNFLFVWKAIIVKSEDMKQSLRIKKASVIPNGVDMDMFHPMPQKECQMQLGWDNNKKHILFPAHPERYEKNYALAEQAFRELNDTTIQIHCFENIPHAQTPIWYNAADVVLLTSLWEGSPNAIKEAMACCRPIVCTQVGDVHMLINDIEGCYVSSFKLEKLTLDVKLALAYTKQTKGSEKLLSLQLDSQSVAKKIETIYYKQ